MSILTMVLHRKLSWLILALPVLLGAQTCAPTEGSPDFGTLLRMRALRVGIAEYVADHGRFPDSLDELCPEPEVCRHFPPEGQPVDAWGNRVIYERSGGEYELRSIGRDKQPYTADDLVLSPAQEQRQITVAAGCYQIALPWWRQFPGERLLLDTVQVGPGLYRVEPTVSGSNGRWWAMGGDSVMVTWAHGPRVTDMMLHHTDSALVGRWAVSGETSRSRTRRVVATRIPC